MQNWMGCDRIMLSPAFSLYRSKTNRLQATPLKLKFYWAKTSGFLFFPCQKSSSNPRRYWPELKKQLVDHEGFAQLLGKIEQLKLESNDGKKYLCENNSKPFATHAGISLQKAHGNLKWCFCRKLQVQRWIINWGKRPIKRKIYTRFFFIDSSLFLLQPIRFSCRGS